MSDKDARDVIWYAIKRSPFVIATDARARRILDAWHREGLVFKTKVCGGRVAFTRHAEWQ